MTNGIQLRLTSTGVSPSNLMIDDIRGESSGGRRGTAPEYIYITAPTVAIPIPSIILTFGGAVPLSFERGTSGATSTGVSSEPNSGLLIRTSY